MRFHLPLMLLALLALRPALAQQPNPPPAESQPGKTTSGTPVETGKAAEKTPAPTDTEKPTGLAGWICDKTGWLFCGLPYAGVPRGPSIERWRTLASYDLEEQREEILLEDCSSCRALATLGDRDLAVLKPSGLFRWSLSSTQLESMIKRDDLLDFLGRPANDTYALLLTAGEDSTICPSILRLDLESGELTEFPHPALGKEVSECPWVVAGARADQFDSALRRQLLATGGAGEFRPSILMWKDLKTGDMEPIAETGPLADGRSRYAPIWLSDSVIVYFVSQK